MSITLPFDIIDCIINISPEISITTYNKIITNRKRKRTGADNTEKYYIDLVDYLLDNKTNYLKKSYYFKYLINIDNSVEIYKLLTKYIKKDNIFDMLDINSRTTDFLLGTLETTILEHSLKTKNNNNVNVNENINVITSYSKYLAKLVDIYKLNNPKELPDFIKIYLLLKSCNYLQLNDRLQYNGNNNTILSFIDVILADENNTYAEYILESGWYNFLLIPEYKFIPLFNISLGMGYNFMIGYDIILDRLIGFIEGGGCAQENEYNKLLIEKYLQLDKKKRLEKYQKINHYQNKLTSKYKGSKGRKQKDKLQYKELQSKEQLENITKYLELLIIDIHNISDHFNYFNEMHLNILDN